MLTDAGKKRLVIEAFEVSQPGDIKPRVAIKAVDAQLSLHSGFLGTRSPGDHMIRCENVHDMASSTQLVHDHVADQLIAPEIMRGIEVC